MKKTKSQKLSKIKSPTISKTSRNLFYYYSKDESSEESWIRNPSLLNLDKMNDSNMPNDVLIDLKSKSLPKKSFKSKLSTSFVSPNWYSNMNE